MVAQLRGCGLVAIELIRYFRLIFEVAIGFKLANVQCHSKLLLLAGLIHSPERYP